MLIAVSFPGQQIWHETCGTLSKQLLGAARACNLLWDELRFLPASAEELSPDTPGRRICSLQIHFQSLFLLEGGEAYFSLGLKGI